MNNQLKLSWIQFYQETPLISRLAFVTTALETMEKARRQLRRTGQRRPQPELDRGYAEFVARQHQLR